jgi:Flp pilus assembly protein TadB
VSTVGVLAALTLLGVVGLVLVVSGWTQPAPSLGRTIAHLQRNGPAAGRGAGARRGRFVPALTRAMEEHPRLLPTDAELQLAERTSEQHVTWLALAAFAGFVIPGVLLGVLQAVGVVGLGWFVPAAGAIGGAVLGPLLVHASAVDRAEKARADMRYQVSAYLDVVTMLLAGNTGYEGALEQAAHAGDGRLFAELRRRVRESGARGSSLTEALRRTGSELGLEELEQVAATAALSASEGAPVARTLAAKCATLRAALATEQETEARLRTSRLTTPIVGMALIFMGLVIYPALNFS